MSKNKKISFKVESVKPRNTTMEILVNCKGGAHGKTKKAERKKDKQNLKKEMRSGGDYGKTPTFF